VSNIEKIYLISNPYTIPKNFQIDKPLSYNFYRFQKSLESRDMKLFFVKQDKNYVYFQVHDVKTKKVTRIFGMLYRELLNFDVRYYYQQIMEELKNE